MEQRSSLLLTSAAVLLAALLVAPPRSTGADGGMTRQPPQSPSILPSWSMEAARRHHWSLPGSTSSGASMPFSSPNHHASRPPLPPPPSDVLRPPQPPTPSRVDPEATGGGSPDLQSTAGPPARPPDQENEISADGYYYLPRATSSIPSRPSGEGQGAPRAAPAHPVAGRPSAGPRQRPLDARRARLEETPMREDIAQRRSGKAETEPEEEVTRKKAPGQANPDIQDIISGIVRLLGGNVNVQANAGTTTTTPAPITLPAAPGGMRPPPPPPSHHVRINNRGPPRITDILFEEDARPPQRPRPPPPPFQPPMKPLVTARPQGTIAVPASGKPGPERPPYPFERPLDAGPRPPPSVPQNKLKPTRQMPRPFATKPAADHPPKLTSILKSSTVTKSSQVKATTAPGRVTSSRPKPTQSSATSSVTSSSKVTKQPTATVISKATVSSSKAASSTAGSKVSATTTGVVSGTSSNSKSSSSTAKVTVSSTTGTASTSSSSSSSTRVQPTKVEIKDSSSSTTISPSKTSSPAAEVVATASILGISTSSSSSEHTPPKEKEEVHPVNQVTSTPPLTSVAPSATNLEPSIQEPPVLTSVEEASSGSLTQRPTPPFSLPPVSSTSSTSPDETPLVPSDRWPHLPRPGIVLDDTEYKPGLVATEGDIVTAAPPHRVNGGHGEVFDVTVSAIQGPGGNTGRPFVYPVDVDGVQLSGGDDVITGEPGGHHDFVSIDGKRTYIDLFPTRKQPGKGETVVHTVGTNLGFPQSPPSGHYGTAHPEPVGNLGEGTGYAVPEVSSSSQTVADQKPKHPSANVVRRPPNRRPSHPPVRIDTCIVGDPSTCDQSQHESCRTEQGVSSCHCRPGYARRKHREPCRGIISVMVAMKVGRVYDQLSPWTDGLLDPNSDDYLQMEWEANKAIDSAMSMTPYSDDFLGSRINGFKKASGNDGNSNVVINATLEIVDSGGPLDSDRLHNHLMGVVRRRRNNIGDSALWVESPDGAFSPIMDVDECSQPELNDCSSGAECTNLYGLFKCRCKDGLRDPALPYGVLPGQPVTPQEERRIGRRCEACSAQAHCMSRGTCTFGKTGEVICTCTGNFYGAQCEVDGEVVGVAVGASVAAIVIIVLTLVCLCMWSRRWNKQDSQAQQEVQKKHHLAAMTGIRGVIGSGPIGTNRGMMSPPPIFAYLPGGGTMISGHKGSAPTLSSSGPSSLPPPPPAYYPLSSEDRMRWAQINEAVVSQQNHYAPEPVPLPTRPSSAIFGAYGNGTLGSMATLPHHGTLGSMTALRHIPGGGNMMGMAPGMFPTAPHMRQHQVVAPSSRSVFGSKSVDAVESSDDDEDVVGEDHHKDLLGRSFHVPRPKSRSSIANQSGIYYDVDYEQSDPYGRIGPSSLPKQPPQPPIPMSTYTPGLNRHYFK
ncbi:uncharacterized protein LOC124169248 isoform X2 [Ischnura elegans]|uniref:uncharacterized protein LOC124169248 isoform X2 n=1 Tax=Ischnura elegans TaxID=197161 RepID=UPI001ED8B397|nr:uncharacterized protein LOC124169248 isoform X2 [Ischnura elegans]